VVLPTKEARTIHNPPSLRRLLLASARLPHRIALHEGFSLSTLLFGDWRLKNTFVACGLCLPFFVSSRQKEKKKTAEKMFAEVISSHRLSCHKQQVKQKQTPAVISGLRKKALFPQGGSFAISAVKGVLPTQPVN